MNSVIVIPRVLYAEYNRENIVFPVYFNKTKVGGIFFHLADDVSGGQMTLAESR